MLPGSIFSHKSSPSLINGSTVSPDSHLYLVSLHAGVTGHYCAGTLIAADTVLTAASCVKDFAQSSELTLYVGRRTISSMASAEDKGVMSNTASIYNLKEKHSVATMDPFLSLPVSLVLS